MLGKHWTNVGQTLERRCLHSASENMYQSRTHICVMLVLLFKCQTVQLSCPQLCRLCLVSSVYFRVFLTVKTVCPKRDQKQTIRCDFRARSVWGSQSEMCFFRRLVVHHLVLPSEAWRSPAGLGCFPSFHHELVPGEKEAERVKVLSIQSRVESPLRSTNNHWSRKLLNEEAGRMQIFTTSCPGRKSVRLQEVLGPNSFVCSFW